MSYQPPRSAFGDAQPAQAGQEGPLTYAPAKRDADALVRQYLPLVKKLAWHVHGSMSTLIDVEDLIQVGLVALVEASAQATEQGAQFRAYLVTRLRGSMIDELRRQATTTRGALIPTPSPP